MDINKDSDYGQIMQKLSEFYTMILRSEGYFVKREATKAKIPIYELMTRQLHNIHVVCGGSAVDGTMLPTSDVDYMYVSQNIIAFDKEEYKGNDKNIFHLETCGISNNACYVRLLYMDPGVQLLHVDDSFDVRDLTVDIDGKSYLSSEQYRLKVILPNSEKWKSSYCSHTEFIEHGPCATTAFQFDHLRGNRNIDFTEGIQCCDFPLAADEWLKRKRSNSWPPECLIEKAKNIPVYVVPVGNLMSQQCSIEWRLSFARIERELSWSFSETQFHSYFILKFLVREYIEPIAPNELSSYHLKTVIFWLSENSEVVWKPSNLLTLLQDSLQCLGNAVDQRSLPHFIVKDQNLLLNKFVDPQIREKVVKKIDTIRQDFIPAVIECNMPMTEDHKEKIKLVEILLEEKEWLPRLLELSNGSNEMKSQERFYMKSMAYSIIISMVRNPIDGTKLGELQDLLDSAMTESNLVIVTTVKIFTAIRLGMLYHLDYMNITDPSPLYFEGGVFKSDVIDPSNEYEKVVRLNGAKCAFELGCMLDGLSGHLYYAMFLLVQYDLEQMLKVMNELMNPKHALLLSYEGLCSNRNGVFISSGELSQTNNVPETFGENFHGPVCYDVILIGDDVRCVPDAIKFECELNEYEDGGFYFLFHPTVFAYYLLFELQYNRQNTEEASKALVYLAEMADATKGGYECYRAFNLLGYCYSRVGLQSKAFECFNKSLQIKNFPQNAALYHVCMMVYSSLV